LHRHATKAQEDKCYQNIGKMSCQSNTIIIIVIIIVVLLAVLR